MGLQERYAAAYRQNCRLLSRVQASAEKGQALFDSLLQRAFRGEL
jgi:hypothetical protein